MKFKNKPCKYDDLLDQRNFELLLDNKQLNIDVFHNFSLLKTIKKKKHNELVNCFLFHSNFNCKNSPLQAFLQVNFSFADSNSAQGIVNWEEPHRHDCFEFCLHGAQAPV